MATGSDALERDPLAASEHNPFAEALREDDAATAVKPAVDVSWAHGLSPFEEWHDASAAESEDEFVVDEAFTVLRDDAFGEAIAHLADEAEQAVQDRFSNETAANAAERARYAETWLSPVRFEAQQYLDGLSAGLSGLDLASLPEAQLDEMLDRFDPSPAELTPAGEEFIGALVRKAKRAVKFVARTATRVGKAAVKAAGAVAGGLLGPVLARLQGLVKPLLRRVLSFAIGRLPATLQPAARTLAGKLLREHASDEADQASDGEVLRDPEALAEAFDAALAESFVASGDTEFEDEADEHASDGEDRGLERLAEARTQLIARFRSAADGEDVTAEVEQFIPALLGALRLGIQLAGRPRVVGFLAGFLGRSIRGWVGPKLAGPLSSAIVDTGLKLMSLESPFDEDTSVARGPDAAPQALAAVVEETVRRFASSEDFVFEDEDLMRSAAADALGEAVATHFPERFVRPGLQMAPSLGGTFVPRHPFGIRAFHKYTRAPEVEITEQLADALPSFGGTSVGAALRAAGFTLPMRARVHMYQAAPGTTVARLARMDPAVSAARVALQASTVHPLTTRAAGMLLREPRLGVDVANAWLRSRQRVAPGQRLFILQPVGASMPARPANARRLRPSRRWLRIEPRRGRIVAGLYFAESDAQRIASALRAGHGATALVQALAAAFRGTAKTGTPPGTQHLAPDTPEFEFEGLSSPARRRLPAGFIAQLRSRVQAWVLPALASWARGNAEAFVRAAADPSEGVTVRIRLTSVPGFGALRDAVLKASGAPGPIVPPTLPRGTPAIAIDVRPGAGRR